MAPRKPITVSQWADLHRRLSSKAAPSPALAHRPQPHCASHGRHERLLQRTTWCSSFLCSLAKREVAINILGYTMEHHPGPVMVCLPGEVSLSKWVAQKLNPMIDETPSCASCSPAPPAATGPTAGEFKDFAGGQLYIEHAGSPQRLKSTTVRTLLVDELDEFAASLHGGDDPSHAQRPHQRLPGTYKRLYISTPQIKGLLAYRRVVRGQRPAPVPRACHTAGTSSRWNGQACTFLKGWQPYVAGDCGAQIDRAPQNRHHRSRPLGAHHPERKMRGYQTQLPVLP